MRTVIDSLTQARAAQKAGHLDRAIAILEDGIRRRKGRRFLGAITNFADMEALLKDLRIEKAKKDLAEAQRLLDAHRAADDPLDCLNRAHRLSRSVLGVLDTEQARELTDRIRAIRSRLLAREGLPRIREIFRRGGFTRALDEVRGLLEESPNDAPLRALETEIEAALVKQILFQVNTASGEACLDAAIGMLEELVRLVPHRDDLKRRLDELHKRRQQIEEDLDAVRALCEEHRYAEAERALERLRCAGAPEAESAELEETIRYGRNQEDAARTFLAEGQERMGVGDGPAAAHALGRAWERARWLPEIASKESELAARFGPKDRFRMRVGERSLVVLLADRLAVGRNTAKRRENDVYCVCPDISRSPRVFLVRQGRRFFLEDIGTGDLGRAALNGRPVQGRVELTTGSTIALGEHVRMTFTIFYGTIPTARLSVVQFAPEYPEDANVDFVQLGSRIDLANDGSPAPEGGDFALTREDSRVVLTAGADRRRVVAMGMEWRIGKLSLRIEEDPRCSMSA